MKTMLFKSGAKIQGPGELAYQFTRDVLSLATAENGPGVGDIRIPTNSVRALDGALELAGVNGEFVKGAPEWFWDAVGIAQEACWHIVAKHQFDLDRPELRRSKWDGSIA